MGILEKGRSREGEEWSREGGSEGGGHGHRGWRKRLGGGVEGRKAWKNAQGHERGPWGVEGGQVGSSHRAKGDWASGP